MFKVSIIETPQTHELFDKFIEDCFLNCKPSYCNYTQFEQIHDKFQFDILAALGDPNSNFLEFHDITANANLLNVVKNIQNFKPIIVTTAVASTTSITTATATTSKKRKRNNDLDAAEEPPNKIPTGVCKNLLDKINSANNSMEPSIEDNRKMHFTRLLKLTCSILTDYIQ